MEQIKWPFLKQTWGIEFESSKGAYLYTKDGRKILDAAGGAIVNNICLLYTSPSPRDRG